MNLPHQQSTSSAPLQLDLFGAVVAAYMDGKPRSNAQLYDHLVDGGHITRNELAEKQAVGTSGALVSVAKRKIRWWQQTLRSQGVLERLPDERGTWRIADRDKNDMTTAPPNVMALGFSTKLGVAVWGSCKDVFGSQTDSIAVCITSPPYALAQPRAYGNPTQDEWVDFVCACLEPIVKRLLPGGSIAVNLSNDVFEPGLPSRSLYREEFVIAMRKRLGMFKMDEIVWSNPSKPPGPIQWASKRRMQLNTGYEPVLVFCNDPMLSFADNRRVLQPHSDRHKKLMARGGEARSRVNSDGAYRINAGAYGSETAGRIPKNVLSFGHSCADQRRLRRMARDAGLPVHGASMPLSLAMFLVQYLSRPGDLVVDPFGGTQTTAKACEELGRLWKTSEMVAEYIWNGRFRFASESLTSDALH
jgi:DNA modification methylase